MNEARFGLTGGTVVFNGENSLDSFTGPVANQAGFSLNLNGALGITNATVNTGSTRRNSPTWNFNDTLSWSRGAHTFSFGGNFFQGNYFTTGTTFVPTINFGLDSTDPAVALFTANKATIFPGIGDDDFARAQNLYATLVGSVTSINANAGLDEETGKYFTSIRVRCAPVTVRSDFSRRTSGACVESDGQWRVALGSAIPGDLAE